MSHQFLVCMRDIRGPGVAGEEVVRTWDVDIVVFDPNDSLYMVLTLGLYKCISQSAGSKKRRVCLTLTNRRVRIAQRGQTFEIPQWNICPHTEN